MTQRDVKGLREGLRPDELEYSLRQDPVQTRRQVVTMVDSPPPSEDKDLTSAAGSSVTNVPPTSQPQLPTPEEVAAALAAAAAAQQSLPQISLPAPAISMPLSGPANPNSSAPVMSREEARFLAHIEAQQRAKDLELAASAALSAAATAHGVYSVPPPPPATFLQPSLLGPEYSRPGIGYGPRVFPTPSLLNPLYLPGEVPAHSSQHVRFSSPVRTRRNSLEPYPPYRGPTSFDMGNQQPWPDRDSIFHAQQIEAAEGYINAAPAATQKQLRTKLYRQYVFPFTPSVSSLHTYGNEVYLDWLELWNQYNPDHWLPLSCLHVEAALTDEQLSRFTAQLKATAFGTGSSSSFQPQLPRKGAVDEWITQLGRRQPAHITIDGCKDGDAQRFVDLKLTCRNMEPPMTFNLADCSRSDQLAVWDARMRLIGRHLQGTALHSFSAATDSAESSRLREDIRSGRSAVGADHIFQATLLAVEQTVCEDKNPVQFHLDKLDKVRQRSDVATYNKLFKNHLAYISPPLGQRETWKMWLSGLKEEVKRAVELQFVRETDGGAFPMQAAMRFAQCWDDQQQERMFGGNPFGSLRLGGPTEGTPFAAHGGRGYGGRGFWGGRGGGFQGGRGFEGNGSWGNGQQQGSYQGGQQYGGYQGSGNQGGTQGGNQGHWWQQPGRGAGAGRGAPPPPGQGAGRLPVGAGRGAINPNA
jgi:hypothetical protein